MDEFTIVIQLTIIEMRMENFPIGSQEMMDLLGEFQAPP
ncbi:BgTH12-03503 [Blumeria graminis f. sp. triticale]|uniref:Bgt-50484 n=2 Tax=Blumeria graminis TaxID=34373 RepID=A0A9X9PQT3_BLUGR|nr:BgTH12-03503 [Blumeria graminis f. sp. triticale]VCU39538.1 Bgt-50484 [Blumeria graminis f. sp. tritici]